MLFSLVGVDSATGHIFAVFPRGLKQNWKLLDGVVPEGGEQFPDTAGSIANVLKLTI